MPQTYPTRVVLPVTPDKGAEILLPLVDPVIWIDPERMSGAPCFIHTRVPVQALWD
jgi:hypothetical protein